MRVEGRSKERRNGPVVHQLKLGCEIESVTYARTEWVRHNIAGCAFLDDFPPVEYEHAIGKQRGIVQVMRHENCRSSEPRSHLQQLFAQSSTRAPVYSRERFVEEEYPRVARKGARKCNALLLSARECRRLAIIEPIKVHACKELARAVVALPRWMVKHCRGHVLQRAQVREEGIGLKDEPCPASLGFQRDAPLRIEPDLRSARDKSRRRRLQAGNGAQRGSLSCTRRPDDSQEFTRCALERNRKPRGSVVLDCNPDR
jgi:hypothetical protein